MSKIFKDCTFCFSGALSCTRNEISALVKKHGGKVSSSVTKSTTHLVTNADAVTGETGSVQKAQENEIHIVGEDFVNESIEQKKRLDESKYSLVEDDDGSSSPPAKKDTKKSTTTSKKRKIQEVDEDEDGDEEEESDEPPTKKQATTKKVIANGKYPVDSYSGYERTGKIYVEGKDVYSVSLNQTDIKFGVKGNNKFYIIQLIDTGKGFVVFTRWGRVGAAGQKASKSFPKIDAAKKDFVKKFKDKTGNEWEDRESFVKKAKKYVIVETSYDDDEEEEATEKPQASSSATIPPSQLDSRVQDLIKLISNQTTMTETLKEFEIDIKRMPLGKLSKKQILAGYEVLKRIQRVLDGEDDPDDADVEDLSSEFYSLIPHSFGMNLPPAIDNPAKLKKKMEMLETLGDLEIASKLLKGVGIDRNPVDAAYETLKTKLVPVEKDTDLFKTIQTYVKNTHAASHADYTLDLQDVFTVEREGEYDRFTAYKSLHNKKLLWHGSRLTNYMGILSQGLRIAPPEAPVTGYMFGKGVYFADMVSKSANYCRADLTGDTGIMLLSEVALGKCYERLHAEFVQKLPNGTHSTFGRGKIQPDPSMSKFEGDIEIPLGTPVDSGIRGGALQYNEFIVYDVAQINIKYLLKLKFNYN